jgi:hypothetical protein
MDIDEDIKNAKHLLTLWECRVSERLQSVSVARRMVLNYKIRLTALKSKKNLCLKKKN